METFCDLDWVKAEYDRSQPACPRFGITVKEPDGAAQSSVVREKDGDQFAAELDVLAAIIRAKVIRARPNGWAAIEQAPQASLDAPSGQPTTRVLK